MIVRLLAAFAAICGPAGAGQLVCHFDTGVEAEVNDFGERQATGQWALAPPGSGCPVHPNGRALDAGQVGDPAQVLEIPVSPQASFAQGTMECWVKTRWDWQTDRDQHSFLFLPLEGGPWNSLCLYHHGRMGEARTLAFNIHDGVDNCIVCPVEQLGWKEGEWHHLAASWTEHSQWLFADGKLVAKRFYENPIQFTAPVGSLRLCPPGLWGSATAVLLDEVRLSDRPLYVGCESFPLPTAPLPDTLPTGLLELPGTQFLASSTAAPVEQDSDVPELHNGQFGETIWLDRAGAAWVRVDLPEVRQVAAVRWSRDGRPLKGPNDFAHAGNIPRDFVVEASADGQAWRPVVTQKDFWYDPDAIPREGMVFQHAFPPTAAKHVRFTVTKGQPGGLGPRVALDEIQVLDEAGNNLARSARVVTARTSFRREFAPEKVADGRLGEESCWRAATPGPATLEVVLARPGTVEMLTWSRSAEGLAADGTPRDLVIEAQAEGGEWIEIGRVTGNTDPGRHEVPLQPAATSRLRIHILSTVDGKEAVLDEIAVR